MNQVALRSMAPNYDFDPPIEFDEGYNSQVHGAFRIANPYVLGTSLANHWFAGWDKAYNDYLDTLED